MERGCEGDGLNGMLEHLFNCLNERVCRNSKADSRLSQLPALNTPTAATPRPCFSRVARCKRALAGSAMMGDRMQKPCSRWQLVRKMGNLQSKA